MVVKSCSLRRGVAHAVVVTASLVASSTAVLAQTTPGGTLIDEIIITAEKRPEALSTVPMSATAFDQATLNGLGAKDFADVARMTPGITYQGYDDDGDMNVAIRGIISGVGAPTTGIYIDDTPIQIRLDAGVWSNFYPKLFDLDRIEVLRGPQGTLFGGSSEGGTIRFITPEASLTSTSGYARAEVAMTEHGDPSWETGLAFGTPIVEDKLGMRVSLWHRDDGGYANRYDPATGALDATHVNGAGSTVGHIAFKFAPTENLLITASMMFQDVRSDDKGLFWESAGTYGVQSQLPQPHNDHAALPSLGVEYDFEDFSVKSITSFMDYVSNQQYDSTSYELTSFAPGGAITVPFDPNYYVGAHFHSSQQSWTQELRLTSLDQPGSRFTWVGGLFYQHLRSLYDGTYEDPNLDALANYVSNYNGNGPADSASQFGEALIDGRYSFIRHYVSSEHDMAAFGDVTYEVLPDLKLAAGLRVSDSGFGFNDFQDGPWGPAAPTSRSGSERETPVTPRFTLSYQIDLDQMVYTTAAKGYRIGGVNQPVPSAICAADLSSLGLSSAPATYQSDSLWSYEAGIKGRYLNRTLSIAASVYWIDWSQIQQSISLVQCGYGFTGNLGKAASRGFDVQARWALGDRWSIYGTTGLTDARFTQTLSDNGQILAKAGDSLATPEWTGTAGIERGFDLWASADGYARIDYQFTGPYYRGGSADTFGYDGTVRNAPAQHALSARAGAKFSGWDVSLFGNNLLDSSASLYRYRDSVYSFGFRDLRPVPLSVGLAGEYRF